MAKAKPLMTKGMLTATLTNNDDVLLWLKKTPEAFKRKLLISLLRNSAKPWQKEAKQKLNSSVKKRETGKQEKQENQALTDSISFKTHRKINDDLVAVGVKAGNKRSVVKKFPDVQKYAVGIEWGMFNKSAGYGYMRKAFESKKGEVYADFLGKSKKIIERTQKRYLKQGRYSAF